MKAKIRYLILQENFILAACDSRGDVFYAWGISA